MQVDTPLTRLRRAPRRTLVEHAYQELLHAISSGRLPPGRRVVIDTVAAELGVSITPVREALRRLQHDGLIREVPYSGMEVARLSRTELGELLTVIGVLEGFAVRQATDQLTDAELDGLDAELRVLAAAVERGDVIAFRRLNDHWHRSIVQRGTGAGVLDQLLEQLHRNAGRYRAAGDLLDGAYMLASQAEHEQLLGLLRQRRAADAELLCRQHARTFVEHLARHLDPAHDHLPT